jgi:hypothetical protein
LMCITQFIVNALSRISFAIGVSMHDGPVFRRPRHSLR